MKKLLILSTTIFLSACACFNSSAQAEGEDNFQEAAVVSQPAAQAPVARQQQARSVRVYDNEAYAPRQRRVKRIYYNDAAPEYPSSPRPMVSNNDSCTTYADYDSPCKSKVRETREPVEVIYKNTRYTTVYKPETYKDVRYTREPYARQVQRVYTQPTSEVVVDNVIEEDDYIK